MVSFYVVYGYRTQNFLGQSNTIQGREFDDGEKRSVSKVVSFEMSRSSLIFENSHRLSG